MTYKEVDKPWLKNYLSEHPILLFYLEKDDFEGAFNEIKKISERNQFAAALLNSAIGDSMFKKMKSIPDNFVRGFEIPTSITIPDSIESIGFCAFYGTPLENVELSNYIKEIGAGAFGDTKIKEIHLPTYIEKVGHMAFGKADVYSDLDSAELNKVLESDYYDIKKRITARDIFYNKTGEKITGEVDWHG